MPLLRKFFLLPVAMATLLSTGARADEFDTFQFKVGQSLQHDSNVFRLSDSANTAAVLGKPERSDTIAVTTVGVKVDKTYSLQRFEIDLNADRFSYRNFSNLDFTAVNYAAAWRWSLTPRFHGNLTTEQRKYVDTSADLQNFGQLNVRTDRSSLADAEYEIDGAWRAVAGFFERETTNRQALTFEGDSKVKGAEGGVRYVFPSGTSMAYRLRQGNGEYPGRTSNAQFASDFKDTEHEFRLDWPVTGKTTIESRVSHFDRSHEGLAARNFSGLIGQVRATWDATGKTRVIAGLGRELSSYQTNTSSYYEGYQFFLAPTWKPTAKTSVQLRYDHGVRDYKGGLPGFASLNRRDTLNTATLAFEWQPTRVITVTASAARDNRKSNEPGFDYKSNVVNLAVLARF